MSQQRPTSVTVSMWLIVGVMALCGVSALLTVPFQDELLAAWRAGRPETSAVEEPAFVPVALVMFVVVAMLTAVLLMFFREGHNWSRLILIALMLILVAGMLAVLRTGPPAFFVVLCSLGIVGELVSVGFLVHKDTRAWFASEPASEPS